MFTIKISQTFPLCISWEKFVFFIHILNIIYKFGFYKNTDKWYCTLSLIYLNTFL